MIEIVPAGDPRRKALDRVRDKIAAVRDKLDELEAAFVTIDEAVARIIATTSDGLETLRLSISQVCHAGWRGPLVPAPVFGGGGDHPIISTGGVDPLVLTRFTMGEEAFASMIRERVAEAHPDAAGAVVAAERPVRRAKLEAEIDELLGAEEAAIAALEAKALFVERRPIEHGDTAAVDRFLAALVSA